MGASRTPTATATISDLPFEVRRMVVMHLSRSETCGLARVSMDWNQVAEEGIWWELDGPPRRSGQSECPLRAECAVSEQDIAWYAALAKSYSILSTALQRVPARAKSVRKIDLAISPYTAKYDTGRLLSLVGSTALHVKLDYVPGVVPTALSYDSLRESLAQVHLPVARTVILPAPVQVEYFKPAGPFMRGPMPWTTMYRYWIDYGDVLHRLPELCPNVRRVGVVNERVHSMMAEPAEGDVRHVEEQPASNLDVRLTMHPDALLSTLSAIRASRRLTEIRLLSPDDAARLHAHTDIDSHPTSRDNTLHPDLGERCFIFRFRGRFTADDPERTLYVLSFALVHRYPHATIRRSYHLVAYGARAWQTSESELRGLGLWTRMEGIRGGAVDLPQADWDELGATLALSGDGLC